MCDINCIWLFNLLVAFVLIIQQQQHVVVCTIHQQRQPHNSFRLHSSASSSSSSSSSSLLPSSRDGITSYASALATKYLHQHSLPKVNVVKREIRNDRNTDFISYLSDFNMQDETSIPEDIFDQRHLREIEQKERIAGKKTGGIATDVADGDDVIDVNLPYDDSDADADAEADADIILESQRSIERNFSTSDNDNTNNDSHNGDGDRDEAGKNDDGIEDRADVRPKDNMDGFKTLNLKKTNNKMKNAMFKASKTFKTARSNDEESQQGKEITYASSIETFPQHYTYESERQQLSKDAIEDDNYYDGIIDDEEDDDDGSAEYERFKLMHEQKQREQQLQKEREHLHKEKQRQDLNNLHLRKDHTSPLKKLNERIFNKPSENGNEQRLYDDMDNSADQDDNNADNNKNNDEEDEFAKSQHHGVEKSPQQQKQQPQQDAIGDIDDESSSENPSISKAKLPVKDNKAFTNMFIPRKMKRHNGAARLDDATNRYTRIKKQQQQLEDNQHNTQQQQQQQQKHQQSIIAISNENQSNGGGSDDVDNQDEYMPHFGATQQRVDNFKKSYYGIVNVNSTQTDDLIELKENGASKKDNSEQHNVNDAKDVATAIAMPTSEATPTTILREENKRQSLFEIEKSMRRNNKHYGHKTHKKKYKDYLRYSSLMLTRVPASPTTTTTTPASTMAPQSQQEYPVAISALDNAKGQKNVKNMIKMQKGKGKSSPPSPIFVVKPKQDSDSQPFYEGKIHYYLETDDDDDDDDVPSGRDSEGRVITKGDRVDTNDWYHKLVPLLRNGVKKGSSNSERDDRISVPGLPNASSGNGGASGGYTPYHHYRSHHQRNHHHHNHHHNHQHQKHHQHHMRNHAYQRKVLPKTLMVATTPMPPPSRRHTTNSPIQELAHQITDVKEFEHYYAKWPHLARVQSQLHDEQVREQLELQNLQQQQLGNYQDYEYDEDYFEALQSGNVEENVPPYIRKYNRRNKQLLDLLEGTLPPPTRPPQQLRWAGSKLQPGPRDSSVGSMSVRIDDEYLKEKRKRYHQRQKQIHDLFEQQRPSTTTMAPTFTYPNEQQGSGKMDSSSSSNNNNHYENRLPDEDISISMDSQEHDENESKVWQKDQGSKLAVSLAAPAAAEKSQIPWQRQTITAASSVSLAVASTTLAPPAVVSTLKPAIFKLPSYPSIAGSFMQRPRSRSAQFAPSSGSDYRRVTPLQYMSGNNNFINAGGFVAYSGAMGKNNAQHQNNGKSMSARFSATDEENNKGSTPKPEATNTSKNNNNNRLASGSSSSSLSTSSSSLSSAVSTSSSSPASVSNTFVYHRVMDASPRLVGAGLTGRKQRLPFVAITDRRLETSKKSLTDHQKDFEQNHYPMP